MTTALVVDDSPGDRKLAALLLEEMAAVAVRQATGGNKALRLLEEETPDLVLTDLMMPDLDGLQLVETIHERWPTVPVILMTGHGSEQIAADALRRGAASYVPKDNLMRDLGQTVQTVLAASAPSRHIQRLVASTDRIEFHYSLKSDPDFIKPLVSQLQAYLVPMGLCDQTECLRVGVALVEAMQNAIYHGNLQLDPRLRETDDGDFYKHAATRRAEPLYGDRHVDVTARMSHEEAAYVIRDEGEGFDPDLVPDPRDPCNLQRCTGRGLLLIRTFMDEVRFNDVGNQITMVKRAESSTSEASAGEDGIRPWDSESEI